MFASKSTGIAVAIVTMILYAQVAQGADTTSIELNNLKRALEAPNLTTSLPTQRRTRAIVFDNEPASSTKIAEPRSTKVDGQVNQDLSEPIKAAQVSKIDCTQLASASSQGVKPIPFSIQFVVGSSEISPSSRDVLGSIGSLLQSMLNDRCILIEGHTDISGAFDRNMDLSAERANSVVDFLVRNYSLPRQNIISSGKGPTEILPGVDPKSPRNRRVVFKIIG